jgi:hypothetical protein
MPAWTRVLPRVAIALLVVAARRRRRDRPRPAVPGGPGRCGDRLEATAPLRVLGIPLVLGLDEAD